MLSLLYFEVNKTVTCYRVRHYLCFSRLLPIQISLKRVWGKGSRQCLFSQKILLVWKSEAISPADGKCWRKAHGWQDYTGYYQRSQRASSGWSLELRLFYSKLCLFQKATSKNIVKDLEQWILNQYFFWLM